MSVFLRGLLLTVSVWYTTFVNVSTTVQGVGSLSHLRTFDTTHRKSAQHCSFEFFVRKSLHNGIRLITKPSEFFSQQWGKTGLDNGKLYNNKFTFCDCLSHAMQIPITHRLIRLMRLLNLREGIERRS
jgi:hypothetical protein